jgi:hypothetical protein
MEIDLVDSKSRRRDVTMVFQLSGGGKLQVSNATMIATSTSLCGVNMSQV